jgi:hypothetical protein
MSIVAVLIATATLAVPPIPSLPDSIAVAVQCKEDLKTPTDRPKIFRIRYKVSNTSVVVQFTTLGRNLYTNDPQSIFGDTATGIKVVKLDENAAIFLTANVTPPRGNAAVNFDGFPSYTLGFDGLRSGKHRLLVALLSPYGEDFSHAVICFITPGAGTWETFGFQ